MAPANSDGHSNSSNPNGRSENPFIKFRRFADAQVGALLQGIVGLPSVFSKQSNEADSRWTNFQDELRRRERAHTKEEASAIPKSNDRGAPDEEEVELPINIVRGGSSSALAREEPPSPSVTTVGGLRQDEIDLYCPLTPALFEIQSNFAENLQLPWEFFGNRKTGSALNIIQSMVYNELYFDPANRSNLNNHAENSILPYVLFSLYSPLALSNMPTPSKGQGLHGRNRQDFPYMAAFEDLLLASQHRRMGLWTHVKGDSSAGLAGHYDEMMHAPINIFNLVMNSEFESTRRKVSGGLSWIRDLHSYGLLGLEPTDWEKCCSDQPNYLKIAEHKPRTDSSPHMSDVDECMTEEEAYEALMWYDEARDRERQAFSPESLWKALSTLDGENVIVGEILRKLAGNENDQALQGNSSTRNAQTSGLEHRVQELFAGGQNSTSTSTQTYSSDDSSPGTSKTRVVSTQKSGERESESRAGWPISTTRTTEQKTTESGRVETKITIEKIFADGRRNVTTTEHVEVPFERSLGSEERDGETQREGKDQSNGKATNILAEGTQDKQKQKRKGGWFWN